MTRQKIGRLRVNDVGNPDVARCKVTKGDAEIASAFREGRGLICVSDGKAFGFRDLSFHTDTNRHPFFWVPVFLWIENGLIIRRSGGRTAKPFAGNGI